jgi:hypothetical protein
MKDLLVSNLMFIIIIIIILIMGIGSAFKCCFSQEKKEMVFYRAIFKFENPCGKYFGQFEKSYK